MELTTGQQTTAFLWAFLLGGIIEMLYTAICAVRVVSPPTKIQLFIGDVIFMIITAILNTLYAILQTEGKVRLYVIAAEIIAYAILYFSVSRYVIKVLSAAILFVRRIKNHIFDYIKIKVRKITNHFKEKCKIKKNPEKN